jgi:hypothetical protein
MLMMLSLCWPAVGDQTRNEEKSPMRIELNAFSGRPNPTWSLNDEEAREFLARFQTLKTSDSKRTPYDGLGYRGFKVAGFQEYDEVTVWGEIVEASRGGKRYRWLDEGRGLEKFLLKTSKGHIDEDLYRVIASAIEQN